MKAQVDPLRVVVKALCLFVVINIVYALIDPPVERLSLYNSVFPGRVRMPFGDVNNDPYALIVDNVDAMFASHIIAKPKQANEYRVVLVGDSSIWGENLAAGATLGPQWNALNIRCRGRRIRVYNLSYPHPSVIKDLIILDKAMEYEPDLIVWFVTLNTLIPRRLSPFLLANREWALRALTDHAISFTEEEALLEGGFPFYEKTLIGKRSELARLIKLQVFGIIWTATGADMSPPPVSLSAVPPDVENNERYRGLMPTPDLVKEMQFNALAAGHDIAGSTPILIVNEPMFIAGGTNSSVRYNDGYPRWAYDLYREAIARAARSAHWNYLDLWNSIPPQYFADSVLHLTAEGERVLIRRLNPALRKLACQ